MDGGNDQMAIRGVEEVALPPPGCCPWLVYYHGRGYKEQSFCSDVAGGPSQVKTYTRSFPVLHDKKVLSCAHGCLVLYDIHAKSLSLCNSTTFDETLILPNLHHLSSNHKIDSCVLLLPPGGCSTNWHDFTVLIFLQDFPSIMLCRVGEAEWSEISYRKYLEPYVPQRYRFHARDLGRPLLFTRAVGYGGGKVYAHLVGGDFSLGFLLSILQNHQILQGAAKFGLVLCRVYGPAHINSFWSTYSKDISNAYMLESRGEPFFFYFSTEAQVFEVYRMNFDTMAWERTKSIDKDTAVFLGENYSLSCPAPSGGSLIYFTRRKDDGLYCYNMEDDSVLMSLPPHPNLPTPCLSPPIWIMPQLLHLSSIKQEDEHNHQDCNVDTSRKLLELNEDNTNACVDPLPFDLLEHVSKYLIATDYIHFRAASKICRSLCPPINWRTALSGTAENSRIFPSPLLMFLDRHESVYKFVCPSINCNFDSYYLMRVPDSLQSDIIHYSHMGWVLMSKRGSCVDLYNPFKREIITYNYIRTGAEERLFFIGKPPGSIRPIRCVFRGETSVSVPMSINPNENCVWHGIRSKMKFEMVMETSPVLSGDAFYFLSRKGKLGKLEIDLRGQYVGVRFEVLEKPQRPAGLKFSDHNFLVECGGKLVSVFLGRAGKWVSVYKLNRDYRVWEETRDLGGYDLYLNRASSSAVPSLSGGNRIYFPVLRGSCDIVHFSMETGRWHFSGSPHDTSTDLYGTRWYPNSCWIKPCW